MLPVVKSEWVLTEKPEPGNVEHAVDSAQVASFLDVVRLVASFLDVVRSIGKSMLAPALQELYRNAQRQEDISQLESAVATARENEDDGIVYDPTESYAQDKEGRSSLVVFVRRSVPYVTLPSLATRLGRKSQPTFKRSVENARYTVTQHRVSTGLRSTPKINCTPLFSAWKYVSRIAAEEKTEQKSEQAREVKENIEKLATFRKYHGAHLPNQTNAGKRQRTREGRCKQTAKKPKQQQHIGALQQPMYNTRAIAGFCEGHMPNPHPPVQNCNASYASSFAESVLCA